MNDEPRGDLADSGPTAAEPVAAGSNAPDSSAVSEPSPNAPEPGEVTEPAKNVPTTVADGIEYALDPNAVAVDRTVGLLAVASSLIPALIVIVVIAVFASFPPVVKPLLFAGWLVVAGGLSGWAAMWPGISHRHIRYRTDPNGFTIWRGVVWHSVISVPRSRVQHIDVVQGPIQRRYGLAKLVIHTAGTQNASVSLTGLPHRPAVAIRDFLIDERDPDVG